VKSAKARVQLFKFAACAPFIASIRCTCQPTVSSDADGRDRAAASLGPASSSAPLAPLRPGTPVPDFVALGHTGASVRLRQLLGKPLALVFYESNDSPVAKALLQALSERWLALQPKLGIVLALAPHSAVEHAAFANSEKLSLLLLSDPERRIAASFGINTPGVQWPVVVLVSADGKLEELRQAASSTYVVDLENRLQAPGR
jgi:peroxiredoxin